MAGAFGIQSPLEMVQAGTQMRAARQQSELADLAFPYLKEAIPYEAQAKTAKAQADALEAQTRMRLLRQGLIAQAAEAATDAEAWDQAMDDLVKSGVKEAGQYIGRYNEKLRDRVRQPIVSPLAGLDGGGKARKGLAGGGDGARAALGGGGALDTGQIEGLVANKTPEEMKEIVTKATSIADAMERVYAAQNPGVVWDDEVAKIGRPDLVGQYSREHLDQLYSQFEPLSNYLTTKGFYDQFGMTPPKPKAQLEKIGTGLYGIEENPAGGLPKVTALVEPQSRASGRPTLVGTTEDGYGVYVGADGEEFVGEHKLGAKPGAGGGGEGGSGGGKKSVWRDKYDTAIANGYSEQQAMEYAGALMGKDFSNDQAMEKAYKTAGKEWSDLAFNGQAPPGDAGAWIERRAKQLMGGYAGADSPNPDTPRPRPKPAAAGPAYTPAQRQALRRWEGAKGPKGKPGTKEEPYVPTTKRAYDLVPPKAWFIDTDGKLVRKGG